MCRSKLESKELDCKRIRQQADLASRSSDNIIADRETDTHKTRYASELDPLYDAP